MVYDGALRSFTLMAITKQHHTILETNIHAHALPEVIHVYTYFKFFENLTKVQIHESYFKSSIKIRTAITKLVIGLEPTMLPRME